MCSMQGKITMGIMGLGWSPVSGLRRVLPTAMVKYVGGKEYAPSGAALCPGQCSDELGLERVGLETPSGITASLRYVCLRCCFPREGLP
jgi:hypothetical protein